MVFNLIKSLENERIYTLQLNHSLLGRVFDICNVIVSCDILLFPLVFNNLYLQFKSNDVSLILVFICYFQASGTCRAMVAVYDKPGNQPGEFGANVGRARASAIESINPAFQLSNAYNYFKTGFYHYKTKTMERVK